MFKRTVDVDEVRNGEVIRGSVIWMECMDGWKFGIALMPHKDDPKRRPNDCEWGCICECPQGEKHLIPDNADDFRALCESMSPGAFFSALREVDREVSRLAYLANRENDGFWHLLHWLDAKVPPRES